MGMVIQLALNLIYEVWLRVVVPAILHREKEQEFLGTPNCQNMMMIMFFDIDAEAEIEKELAGKILTRSWLKRLVASASSVY